MKGNEKKGVRVLTKVYKVITEKEVIVTKDDAITRVDEKRKKKRGMD